jgi:hypothetical protein
MSETVTCSGCEKEVPLTEAYPYWRRGRDGEWERHEFCEECAKEQGPPDSYPEMDF